MKIIGHRGARGLAPENTIAALQKALEHHVDELEFDLRVTKDGIVILHHDRHLTDPNGKRLVLAEYDFKELISHKPDLTTFEEALDVAGQAVPLYIEVKPGEQTRPIIKNIRSFLSKGGRSENLRLGSFSQAVLLELHAALPEIEKIVIEKWSGVRAGRRARQLGTKYISMNQRWLWWGFIRAVKRQGYNLIAYTVNSPRQEARWRRHGLYGIVTDYPDRFENI